MATKKVFYVANSSGNAWDKVPSVHSAQAGSSWIGDNVYHSDGSNWGQNYPMIQSYKQTFNAIWTDSYNGSGIMRDPAQFHDNMYNGDTYNFHSLCGFNLTDLQNFLADGTVTAVRLLINLDSTSLNGSPTINFYPSNYTSKPSSNNMNNWNTYWKSQKQFPNKGYGGYWVDLTTHHLTGGGKTIVYPAIGFMGNTATAVDSCRFTGLSGFVSKLEVTVSK